jgi:hypothetical protein
MGEPCDPGAPSGAGVAEIDRRLRALRQQLETDEPGSPTQPRGREPPVAAGADSQASAVPASVSASAAPRGRAGPLADALARARALAAQPQAPPRSSAPEAARPTPAPPAGPEPAAPLAAPAPAAPDAAESEHSQDVALAEALAELHGRLADALGAYRRALDRALSARAAGGSAHAGEGARAALRAGPFPDPPAVRFFKLLLEQLRVVEEVRLVGYEGQDRAILEVRLRSAASASVEHAGAAGAEAGAPGASRAPYP